MATKTLLTKIRESLPAQEARWISTALSADPLVWASLPSFKPSADGSEFEAGNYRKCSPAHLALRILGSSSTPEELAEDLTRSLEVGLLQTSLRHYQEARRSGKAPRTLAEAGLLAISLRLHWSQESSWKGLLNQLAANGEPEESCINVWQTAIACLYGMTPDPVDMLRGLVSRRASLLSYSLITHAILSNPLSENEQTQVFFNLISGLAPLHQIGWLRFLKFKGKDELVCELAHLMLGKIPASSVAALAEFNPDDWDLETLMVKLIELQRLAGLYRYANQTANEQTMLEKAHQSLGNWAGGLNLQLAEIANLNGQGDAAELFIQNSRNALDTATHLQQEALFQMSGEQASTFLGQYPQAGSNPIGQIYQAGVLAGNHKLNEAANLARQGVQQWLEQMERTGETIPPKFAFDWQPRPAIQVLLDLGLIPEALQMIETLLMARPADRDLIELASMVWEQQGNIDKALAHCETLATFEAESPDQHRHLATLLARKEDWEATFEEESQVLALSNPPEADDLVHHAIAASHLGRWDDVQASAHNALQVQPDNGLAYALLGQADLAVGKMEEAGQFLKQATMLAPEDALGWLLLAEWHERNNDSQKSLETLRAAVLAVPESADVNFRLARICLRQGLLSDGLPFLRKAASLAPESLDVSLELGQTLYALGRLDEAYNILSMAHHKWPLHPDLAFAFAQAAQATGDRDGAIAGMKVALKKENTPVEWQILYAETLLSKDPCGVAEIDNRQVYLEEAEKAIDIALVELPDHLGAKILKAEVLLAKGALQQAHDMFCKLLESPDASASEIRWRLQAGLGSAALRMGRVASALASLQEATHAQPENIGLQHMLAEAFKAGELVNEALATTQNALKLAPDDLDNLSWFAGMMVELGEPLEAVHALTTASQICPNQPTYWIRMADIYSGLEDEKATRASLEKLLAIRPLKESILRQAALILKKMGDLPVAIDCLKRAVIENEKPSKEIRVELAYLLWTAEKFTAGLEVIQKGIEVEADDGALYTIQADFFTKLERYEAAIASLEHGLNLSQPAEKKTSDFWQKLPESEFVTAEWVEAACDVAQIHVRMADLLRRTGSLSAAYQHAEAAFELQPAAPQIALLAVDQAYAMNLPDQAGKLAQDFDFTGIAPASLSVSDRQDLSSLLAVHAGLTMTEDEMEQAQECIEKGFEIDPKNARLEAAYATLLVLQGNWKQADEAYQKANGLLVAAPGECSKECHFPDYWLGMAAIKTGHLLDAICFFEKAIAGFPNEPQAHLGLGKALTEAAEQKRLFAEVQCVHWLEGDDLLTDDRYEELEKAFQNASRLGATPDIESWRLRGRAAFRPTTQNLRGLAGLMPDPGIARILVAALRRAENWAAALQTGEQFLEDQSVQIQVALTHYHTESIEGLNIARLVVEKRPNDVLGWITLALAARKFGEIEDAYMALNRAISFWPDEPVWQSWAAELAGSLGNHPACVQHWEIASGLRPEHYPYAMALGAAYLRNSQPYQAIAALEKASTINPNRSDLWYMLAQAYRQTGQFNTALQCAEKSGKIEPESAQSLLLCGEIYLAMGQNEAAQQCALQAWNKDRLNEVNLLFYVKVLEVLDKKQEALIILDQAAGSLDSEAIKVERAKLMASQRGAVAALPLLQGLASSNPQSAEILGLLAEAQAKCGDDKAALMTVSDALTLQPLHPELNLLMGKLQHGAGQLDHAVHFLNVAVENDPMLIEAYLELARTYQERRESAQALQIYQAATKIAPQDYRPFYNAAIMLRDGKDYVAAEALLRKAAELAPSDVNIRRQLGAVITLNLIHNSQEASTAHESYWTQDIRR
jgi:tetratricopeptide (TPR) repeat protein